MSWRAAIQSGLRRFGYRVVRARAYQDPVEHFASKCSSAQISTVLDVGANRGQFAKELRRHGYRGHIFSFEPLTEAHQLLSLAAKQDTNWSVAPRVAVGAGNSLARINISRNSASSSLLPVQARATKAEAAVEFAGSETVELRDLDGLRSPEWIAPFALKVDTQGFEMEVLQGARKVLKDTNLVLVELSLVSLYERGARLVDIYSFMESEGFECINLAPGFVDAALDELLQVDGIFVRR